MGFQEPRSEISICNKALSRIFQNQLSGSLDDPGNQNKTAARECRLWYKTIVRQVLSMHHFGLATKRVPLVQNMVNNRSAEWLYSYIPPTDMAFPVMIGPYALSGTVSYYVGVGFVLARLYGKPLFRYEGGVIYSQVADASLDFVSFDITEQDFNEAVEALVVLFLAAVLARSVAKDQKLGSEIHNEATTRLNIEIAQELNVNQPRYDMNVSDAELARSGFDPGILQFEYWR